MKNYSFAVVVTFIVLTAAAFAANSPSNTALPRPVISSDGGPINTCRPGIPCDPITNVRQVASDGGPINTCRPGTPCDPMSQLLLGVNREDQAGLSNALKG